MFKKILLLMTLFVGLAVSAADNSLSSVVISKVDGETSVVFRTDDIAKIKKEVISSDKIVLDLKGVTQADNITTLYKNVPDVGGLVIQNDGANSLKVFIEAPSISKASIVFETPDAAPYQVNPALGEGRVAWCIISIVLLLFIMRSAKNKVSKMPEQPDINELIKEREKAMYRNFKKEVATLPSINYKLKSYRKHVLKGETIRSYESRMTRV